MLPIIQHNLSLSGVGTAVSFSHSRQPGFQPRPLLETDPLLFSRRPTYVQNVIFKHLQQGARVQIWLYDNVEQRLEGKILVSCPAPPFFVCSSTLLSVVAVERLSPARHRNGLPVTARAATE